MEEGCAYWTFYRRTPSFLKRIGTTQHTQSLFPCTRLPANASRFQHIYTRRTYAHDTHKIAPTHALTYAHIHMLFPSLSLPVCRSGLSLPPSLKKGYFHISTSYQLLHFCPIIDQVFSFFNSPRLLLGGCRITMGYTI